MTTLAPDREQRRERYNPEGSLRALFTALDPEILVDGPAGTGKTYAVCHLIHAACLEFPGVRVLMCRKTLTSLTASALVTFQEKVQPAAAEFFGGSSAEPASFRYDNGSRIVVGGMDNPSKILSSEYDLIYVNEATELTEEDWETLTTRLRNGVLKHPRIIGDCNPTYDRHWLLQRVLRGATRRIRSTHADNPSLTEDYLAQLATLTGSRHQRLYLGEWVGMENAIYAEAMKQEYLTEIPERIGWSGRAWGGMDFGRVHYSAVVALTRDTVGRVWVRECWTGHNDKQEIMSAAQRHRVKYGVRLGVTDPIQDWAAQDLGWSIAKSGAGSRQGRIQRVLGLLENGALYFDMYGDGIRDLWDEMMMYRYEVKETDTEIKDVVVRKDDDRVAALEYAIEAMETQVEPPTTVSKPKAYSAGRPPVRLANI